MPFGFPSRRSGVLLGTVVACALLVLAFAPQAQAFPDLIVTVGDTIGPSGQQNSVITVYLDNFVDSIAGFTLWVRFDQQNIARFKIDTVLKIDTTWWRLKPDPTPPCDTLISNQCYSWFAVDPDSTKLPSDSLDIDSTDLVVGSVNKTGTLIQNWEVVRTQSLSSNGTDLLITAYADDIAIGGTTPAMAPQQGGVLIKLMADILIVPDTLQDRTAALMIEKAFLDKIIFSRPNGSAIGIASNPEEREYCWRCLVWQGGNCTDSTKVSMPPCDWTTLDTVMVPYLDTSKVYLYDGSVTVAAASVCCTGTTGNVNMLGIVDLSDMSLLIAYLTVPAPNKPTLPCTKEANINATGIVDLGDLSLLVAYLTVPAPNKPALPACP